MSEGNELCLRGSIVGGGGEIVGVGFVSVSGERYPKKSMDVRT